MDKENRFSGFTDAEIYILQRACVEASSDMMDDSIYDKEEQDLFTKLMNQLIKENSDRIIRNLRKENCNYDIIFFRPFQQ